MNRTTRPPRPDADSPRDTGDPAYNAGMPTPSTNGRTPRGQFAKGNPGGPGNPYARRTAALRSALLDAVTEADIRAVALIASRSAGSVTTAGSTSASITSAHEPMPEGLVSAMTFLWRRTRRSSLRMNRDHSEERRKNQREVPHALETKAPNRCT
jgi:hypothetical protein